MLFSARAAARTQRGDPEGLPLSLLLRSSRQRSKAGLEGLALLLAQPCPNAACEVAELWFLYGQEDDAARISFQPRKVRLQLGDWGSAVTIIAMSSSRSDRIHYRNATAYLYIGGLRYCGGMPPPRGVLCVQSLNG